MCGPVKGVSPGQKSVKDMISKEKKSWKCCGYNGRRFIRVINGD